MKHGAGYRSVPGDPGEKESSAGGTGGVLDDRVQGARWYKARNSYYLSTVCRIEEGCPRSITMERMRKDWWPGGGKC